MTSGFASKGDKVRFLDRNGYERDLESARRVFTKDQMLTVKSVDVDKWSSTYEFVNVFGRYNTVMFEPIYNNGLPAVDKPLGPQIRDINDTWSAADTIAFELWFEETYSRESFGTLPNIMREAMKEIAFKAYCQGWKKGKKML